MLLLVLQEHSLEDQSLKTLFCKMKAMMEDYENSKFNGKFSQSYGFKFTASFLRSDVWPAQCITGNPKSVNDKDVESHIPSVILPLEMRMAFQHFRNQFHTISSQKKLFILPHLGEDGIHKQHGPVLCLHSHHPTVDYFESFQW
eukprot:TRINITY_DN6781_c0_g1_i18.p1 TRINITY_DN6781_c0_g1~~TRINITY_DN6781_c0_g1_i18.p1  ORF type:complete len:144 (+),score=16.99 TRINITY_DN6781_c0_g1_i18:243-674(+)